MNGSEVALAMAGAAAEASNAHRRNFFIRPLKETVRE
jgi:hypothetical protein